MSQTQNFFTARHSDCIVCPFKSELLDISINFAVMPSSLQSVVFYSIEKAIKSYRQFAQRELKKHGLGITVDQWLILKTLQDAPDMAQKELAAAVFKDEASVTRIIALLVKKKYLSTKTHGQDNRRKKLRLSAEGKKLVTQVEKVAALYRRTALLNVSAKEIQSVNKILNKIILNCKDPS
jgi:DNA-binding MarR family transcriptional regulator